MIRNYWQKITHVRKRVESIPIAAQPNYVVFLFASSPYQDGELYAVSTNRRLRMQYAMTTGFQQGRMCLSLPS